MGWRAEPRWRAAKGQWTLTYKGKEHYLCSGANNKAKAWLKAGEIMGDAALPSPEVGKGCVVGELVEQWLRLYGTEWHRRALSPWSAFEGDKLLRNLDAESLQRYARHLQVGECSPRTVRAYVRMARRVLKWATAKGWLANLPVMPKLAKPTAQYRDVPQAVLLEAFKTLPECTRRILEFILATGARPGEVVRLCWKDVNLQGRQVTLQQSKTGGTTGESRIVHLTTRAVEILESIRGPREGWVFVSRLAQPYTVAGLRSICKRRGFTTYQLRHTFAQEARQHIGIDVISKLLGHKDIGTTLIYCHVKDHQAAAGAASLPALLPQRPARKRKARLAD